MSPLLNVELKNCLFFQALELKASPILRHKRAAVGLSD